MATKKPPKNYIAPATLEKAAHDWCKELLQHPAAPLPPVRIVNMTAWKNGSEYFRTETRRQIREYAAAILRDAGYPEASINKVVFNKGAKNAAV